MSNPKYRTCPLCSWLGADCREMRRGARDFRSYECAVCGCFEIEAGVAERLASDKTPTAEQQRIRLSALSRGRRVEGKPPPCFVASKEGAADVPDAVVISYDSAG